MGPYMMMRLQLETTAVNLKLLAVAALAAVLVGCGTTNFKPYEPVGDGIIEGKGGAKSIVDGLEVWEHGEPPRKFKLIGLIDDERGGGPIPMSRMMSDVVKKARESGGDAVIQVRSESQLVGYQSTGVTNANFQRNAMSATGMTTGIGLRKNRATFAVIQYLK